MNKIGLKPGQIGLNQNTISRLQSLQKSKSIVLLFFYFYLYFLSLFLILYISREALVAGRILIEFTKLTAKLYQELNYDYYWAINETSRIFSKVRGVKYDGDNLEWYDLGECDNSTEGLYTKKCISIDSNIEITY